MFVGIIKINKNTMMFRLDDYKLTISNTEGKFTSLDDIKLLLMMDGLSWKIFQRMSYMYILRKLNI